MSDSRPASDVQGWAKAESKPVYTSSEMGAEPAFTKNSAFNKDFGETAGTVCEGNDSRLINARSPTAHTHGNADLTGIAAWAKVVAKPVYTPSEIGAEPTFSKNSAFNKNFGTVSGTVCQGDDSRLTNARSPTSHVHGNTDLTGISSWAKNSSKPTYTASEVGAAPKGMLLWKGSAESISGTSLAVSDWRERFSAVVLRFSGSYPATTVIPLKDNIEYSEVTSTILNSASNFAIYSMNIKMSENSNGTISIHKQNYVSFSYGNWNYGVSGIQITSITGI